MDEEHKLKVQSYAITVGLAVMAYQFFFNWGDDFDFIRLFDARWCWAPWSARSRSAR